jgi:general secretion pathway protein F
VAGSHNSVGSTITLEELAALNSEIAALVRAGVPLDRGLGEIGGDMPGRLGRMANIVGRRMQSGESLSAVLADDSLPFPPVYRAVVRAGLASGRLPAALESVSRATRHLLAAQRLVVAGLVYPVILFLVAWSLFLFFLVKIVPVFVRTFELLGKDLTGVFSLLIGLGRSAQIWGPAVPIVVLILVAVWWIRSSRASLVQPRVSGIFIGWLPWMGGMLRSSQAATFSEILAMLVEHELPLDEGVVLAAEAVGAPKMIHSAKQIAEGLRRGEMPPEGYTPGSGFPPLLEWLMRAGGQRNVLLPALRHSAEIYRRRAARYAEVARVYLPILLTVVIGGTVTLGYALLLFVPWVSFLHFLS